MPYGFKLDAREVTALHADFVGFAKQIKPAIRRAVKFSARETMLDIKRQMPVDSGRARAGWGIWRQGDMVGKVSISKGFNISGKGMTRFEVQHPVHAIAGTKGRSYFAGAYAGAPMARAAGGNVGRELNDFARTVEKAPVSVGKLKHGKARPSFFYTPMGLKGSASQRSALGKLQEKYQSLGFNTRTVNIEGISKIGTRRKIGGGSQGQRAYSLDAQVLKQLSEAGPADAIWVDNTDNDSLMSITQGTRIKYVKYLDEGWSEQAPAGFIRLAKLKGDKLLVKELDKEIAFAMEKLAKK